MDERNRSKARDKEVKTEHLQKQVELANQKLEFYEKENTSLKEETQA